MNIIYLGQSIKHNRKRLNLTQEKLAEQLSISTHYLYQIERGRRQPSLQVLIHMSEIFGVSIDSLFMPDISENKIEADKLSELINNTSPVQRKIIYEILTCIMPYLQK